MIIGIGVDILDIRRIQHLFQKFENQFEKKIFTKQEIEFCKKRKSSIESFAKMFSIKEAVIKAISDVSGIFWHDIEILHDKNGKPSVNLTGNALKNLKKKTEKFNMEISVSDEPPYVTAFVVIESLII